MLVNKATVAKPCPFCGCDVVRRESGYEEGSVIIVCRMCGAVGPANGDKETAITLWNTRNYGVQPAAFRAWGDENKVML